MENMNKNRFSLANHCFLIKGAKRGAIYNLKEGDVYSIDEHAAKLLEECEAGLDIKKILEDKSAEIQSVAMSYLESLAAFDLGQFLGDNGKVIKIPIMEPHPLEFIWLEVTTGCNLRCVHCYSSSSSSLLGEGRMMEADWIRVMKEAYAIGCRKLQFIGGEPFALGEQLLRLVSVCRDLGYKMIEIYTNATLIDDSKIQFLAEKEISVAVSIYGNTSEIHEAVTKGTGSFNRTITTLKKLIARNIPTRVGLIGMNINEDHIDETIKFLKEDMGVKNVKLDLIRPSGRSYNGNLVSQKLMEKVILREPRFPKCTIETFQRAQYGNNCFSKEICVTASGDVFPCIMERDITLGNILDVSLAHIIQEKTVKQIRGLNKDKIEVCKDCEYRYCCFDCRPKAKKASFNGNFFAKPSECLYNPYSGKWGN
ncbi:MAG: radical SAM protein [Patescibacteria group bacterium]